MRQWVAWCCVALSATVLSAQTLPEGARAERDLVYARTPQRELKLDLYLPAGNGPFPVVLYVHGGGWSGGSKDKPPTDRFLSYGWAVASISYRLSGEATFPAQIHDVKAAVRWLRAQAGTYKLDRERIAAWGGSAGGHLVALLGTSGGVQELEGDLGNPEQSSRVVAVVDFFGPSDFFQLNTARKKPWATTDNSPEAKLVGGPLQVQRARVIAANPITHITKDDPPFLILHGDQDDLVPPNQSELLHQALQRAGRPVEYHVVTGKGHGFRTGPEIDPLVDRFLQRHLGRPAAPRSSALPPDARVERDLVYARTPQKELLMDLYRPGQVSGPLPVVLWVHGGAWRVGNKDNPFAARLVGRGYAVASINYRLSQVATFPAQIHDAKAAVRWLRTHAGEYGLDAERIAAWGASAGGHIVALLGTTGGVAELEGDLGNPGVSSRVAAVVDFYGPTDLLQMNAQGSKQDHDAPDSPESLLIGGPIQQNKPAAQRANPITYVTKDDAPFLLVHGDRDGLVPAGQSQLLHEALRAAGVPSAIHIIPGAGHGFRGGPEMDPLVDEFLDRHLKAGQGAAKR